MTDMTHFGRFYVRKHYVIGLWLAVLIAIVAGCTQTPDKQGPTTSGPPPLQLGVLGAPTGEPVDLRPGHPQTYTVKSGDTLWGIAGRFLSSPWQWREIWQKNPDISNPNLIYPGDVIELYYEAGQPRLRLASGERPIVKLSPQVRVESIAQPIPTLPRDTVSPYLEESRVMGESDWIGSAYIVGGVDPRIQFGSGERIFARGSEFDSQFYQVFRPGEEYRDPVTDESLGFDTVFLGDAVLEDDGDPATLKLTFVKRGVEVGDRLIPEEEDEIIYQFSPHPVDDETSGRIITSLSGGFLVGRFQTVVINLGDFDGVEVGHVMATYKVGQEVEDPVTGEIVTLPDEKSGLLMVYKVFDRVSYGLILEANRTIRVLDRVGEP